MLEKGEVDGLICGTVGDYSDHLHNIVDVVGLKDGVETPLNIINEEKKMKHEDIVHYYSEGED